MKYVSLALQSRAAPFVVLFAFVLALSYDVLPTKGGVLNYSDGAYAWPSGGFDFISTWSWSNTGFAFIAQSFAAFQYLPNALTSFLAHLGPKGDAYHSYALYYGPIYACCLIIFFMARRISGSAAYGYFAAVFLILNNFILEQLLVWPVTYFYCLVGLLGQLHILWRIHEEGASAAKIAASILVSVLVHHPFLFVIHFTLQVLFLAFVCMRGRASARTAFLVVGGSVLIQAYWLVPFLYNLVSTSVAETHRASGESAYHGYIYTIRYRALFNLINYPMALDPRINDFVHTFAQTSFNYLLVVIMVVGVVVALRRNTGRSPEMLFFLFLYLFFFNLALGPNSEITGAIWSWAYAHVPGFAYFRSFNRFQVMALVALVVLGAFLFGALKWRFKTAAVALLIVANFACYPIFLSGTFNGMVPKAHIPAEYYQMQERYFKVNTGQAVLSLPGIPYETYTWALNERNDISNPAMYFLFYFLNAPVIFNQYANMLDRQMPDYAEVLAMYYDARPLDDASHELIRKLGVTFVLVHKDRLDTLKKTDRIIRSEDYHRAFAASGRYVLREDNRHFALFELKNPEQFVSGDGVAFKGTTQTKYEVSVRNLRAPIDIKFAQTFHPGWMIYSGGGQSATPEGIAKNKVFLGDIRYLFEKPVVDAASHHKVDGFANGWTLDPARLRANLPPDAYEVNPDGSINVKLRLYFRPQAFLMLGIAISLLAAIACLLALIFRRRLAALSHVAPSQAREGPDPSPVVLGGKTGISET